MHDWNEGQIISEPNCLAPGYMLYECNTCKTTKRVKIEDGSHLYVVKNTKAPAILVELFFLDNKTDQTLYNKVGYAAIAKAIADAI